jgi:hypothetical protein
MLGGAAADVDHVLREQMRHHVGVLAAEQRQMRGAAVWPERGIEVDQHAVMIATRRRHETDARGAGAGEDEVVEQRGALHEEAPATHGGDPLHRRLAPFRVRRTWPSHAPPPEGMHH